MKPALVLLSFSLCLVLFTTGCSEQKAEKDYKRILETETTATDPKPVIAQYQTLIDQYPDTGSATRARERMIALKSRLENEAKTAALKIEQEEKERKLKAEQEEKERQMKAAQAEKERLQKQAEREVLETELKRQSKLLVGEMGSAAEKAALRLHPDTKVIDRKAFDKPTNTEDWDKKIWTVTVMYKIDLQGTLLGINKPTEMIESKGEVRVNGVTQQLERSVSTRRAGVK